MVLTIGKLYGFFQVLEQDRQTTSRLDSGRSKGSNDAKSEWLEGRF
jgi:hypothetical protein